MRANRVFLTELEVTGALGGVAGADQICRDEARQHGLDGNYIALVTGADRPALEPPLEGSRGWQLIDGTWVADTLDEVATGAWRRPLDMTVAGTRVSSYRVWSGASGETCNEWTSAAAAVTGDQRWIPQWRRRSDGGLACSSTFRLDCAELGHDVALVRPAFTHKRVFVTAQSWTPTSAGRDAADAVCVAEAASAGLSGQFLAVLPIGVEPALARFSGGADVEYQNLQGTLVGQLGTGITYVLDDARGLPQVDLVWSGGDPRQPSSQTCVDWTAIVGETPAAFSADGNGFPDASPSYLRPCGSSLRLFCAEP